MVKNAKSLNYLLSTYYYFVTVLVLSFSTVVFVWGLLNQFEGSVLIALLHYVTGFFLVMVSRLFFRQARRALGEASKLG